MDTIVRHRHQDFFTSRSNEKNWIFFTCLTCCWVLLVVVLRDDRVDVEWTLLSPENMLELKKLEQQQQ